MVRSTIDIMLSGMEVIKDAETHVTSKKEELEQMIKRFGDGKFSVNWNDYSIRDKATGSLIKKL